MSDDTDQFLFKQELTRLYKDYERCNDAIIKNEISKDMEILKKAIELMSS